MSYSSEEETCISDSQLEDYSDTCYQQLIDGKFEVKVSGEVYRCPYCSHKKRKQQCGFKDLLQHASAIAEGSYFKIDTKEKGKHLGLLKYLKYLGRSKPAERISPEVLKHSQSSDSNELLVYPWVGVVANIPVTFDKGKYVGGSGEKLKSEFTEKGFNPTRVTPIWSYRSHICFAVVEFSEGWPGFHCAMKFEKNFEAAGKGKQEYLKVKHWGTELYGWIGREDDYYSEMAFGDFLRKFGDLKTINDIEAEEKRKSNKFLSNLMSNVMEEENLHLTEIEMKYNETSISLNNLITEMDKMFQANKEEIQKVQQNTKFHVHNNVKEHQKIITELEQREKELQKREAHNDCDRKILALEKEMNVTAALEHKKVDENVFKLAEDYKTKNEELRKRNMELEKQIIAEQKGLKHKTNDELQEVRSELINFLKNCDSWQWIAVKKMGELDANPFHAACKRMYTGAETEKKAVELCSLWEDHLSDPDWFPFKIVCLEDVYGRKVWLAINKTAVGILYKETDCASTDSSIVIDRCLTRFIDEEDEKLKRLKAEWGSEVQMAVATAFLERIEYNNPTGRDDIWELWNYKEGRKATLREGLSSVLD